MKKQQLGQNEINKPKELSMTPKNKYFADE